MIASNKELVSDRKLFQYLSQHIQPGMQHQYANQTNIQDISEYVNKFMHTIIIFESALSSKIQFMHNRMQELQKYIYRLYTIFSTIVKQNKQAKKRIYSQKRLYSFANSPATKTASQIFQSGKKERYAQSTQVKTKQKQNNQNQKDQQTTYMNKQISFLHKQIQNLRFYINQAHPQTKLVSFQQLQNSDRQMRFSTLRNIFKQKDKQKTKQVDPFDIYHQHTASPQVKKLIYANEYDQKQPEYTADLVSQVERYKSIITQFKKQQQISNEKAQKYRNVLMTVLKQLAYLKGEQLPSYLPCQACQLRQMIRQYMQVDAKPPAARKKYHNSVGNRHGLVNVGDKNYDDLLIQEYNQQEFL